MQSTTFSLRKAHPSDIPAIAEMAKRIWNVHYPPIIGQQQVDYMLDLMYSEMALAQQLEAGQVFYLGSQGENDLGYVSVSAKREGEYMLHKFYIEIDQQSKGLGRLFFNALLEKHPDWKTIRLTVNRKNFKSINFYFRLGFVIEEVKDFDIGNNYLMEDFVMCLRRKD